MRNTDHLTSESNRQLRRSRRHKRLDRFGRIFMSVVLVSNLVPTAVVADEIQDTAGDSEQTAVVEETPSVETPTEVATTQETSETQPTTQEEPVASNEQDTPETVAETQESTTGNELLATTAADEGSVTATITYSGDKDNDADTYYVGDVTATIEIAATFGDEDTADKVVTITGPGETETETVTIKSDDADKTVKKTKTLAKQDAQEKTYDAGAITVKQDETELVKSEAITIDARPVVTGAFVTYSEAHKEQDDVLYSKPSDNVTATINITGKRFPETNVGTFVNVKADGAAVGELSRTDEGNLTGIVTFNTAGTYAVDLIKVSVTDKGEVIPTGQKQVVIDGAAPTVSVSFTGANEVGQTKVTGDTDLALEQWYDIQDNSQLKVEVSSTDTDLDEASSAISLDSNEVGKVLYTATFEAKDFFESTTNTFAAKKLTFSVSDLAGNTTTVANVTVDNESKNISTFEFGSDSYAFDQWPFELSVSGAGDTKSATRNGTTVYNGDVAVSFKTNSSVTDDFASVVKEKFDFANSNVVAKQGASDETLAAKEGTSLEDNNYEATLAKPDNANNSYTVTATLKTAHGVTRETEKTFDIDTTSPEVGNWSITGNTAKGTDDVLYFGKDDGEDAKPTATIELTGSISTIDTSKLKVELVNLDDTSADPKGLWTNEGFTWVANDDKITGTWDGSKLGVAEYTKYRLKLSGTDIFGVNLSEDKQKTSDTFVEDYTSPTIDVKFSGPVTKLTDTIAVFFKDSSIEDATTQIGLATITVKDKLLDTSTVEITDPTSVSAVTWSESTDEDNATVYTATIPYATTETGAVAFGQGKFKLSIAAKDFAHNKGTYTYNGTTIDGTTYEGDTFEVDTESVQFVSLGVYDSEDNELTAVYTANNYKVGEASDNKVEVFKKSTAKVVVTVKDAHFDSANSTITLTPIKNGARQDSSTATVTWVQDTDESGNPTNQWTGTFSLQEAADGQQVAYGISMSLNDLSASGHNETTKVDFSALDDGYYIALDDTPPQVKYVFKSGNDEIDPKVLDNIDYYDTENLTVEAKIYEAWIDSSAGGTTLTYTEPDGTTKTVSEFSPANDATGVYYTTTAALEIGQSGVGADGACVTHNISTSAKSVSGLGQNTTYTYADYKQESDSSSGVTAFVVDGSVPDVSIVFKKTDAVAPDNAPEIVGTVDGVDYYDAKLTATISVDDPTFDKDYTKVYVGKSKSKEESVTWGWDTTAKKWTATYVYDENEADATHALYVDAVDKVHAVVGNSDAKHTTSKSYKDRDGAPTGSTIDEFVIDKTPPEITVTFGAKPIVENASGKDYYSVDKLTAVVTVKEARLDKEKSNIKVEGAANADWSEDPKDDWTPTVDGYTKELTFEQTSYGKAPELSIEVQDIIGTLKAEKGETSDHTVTWNYETGNRLVAGETGEQTSTGATAFVVDNVAPEIKVTLDKAAHPVNETIAIGSDPENVDYYGEAVTASFIIKENNPVLDEEGKLKVSPEADSLLSGLTWTHVENQPQWTAELMLDENNAGDFVKLGTLTIQDMVSTSEGDAHTTKYEYGNNDANGTPRSTKASNGKVEVNGPWLVVDTTDPTIDVELDQEVKAQDKGGIDYFTDVLTAKIKVTEKHFDPSKDAAKITPTGGSVLNSETNNGWSQPNPAKPDEWEAKVTYTETQNDATYDLGMLKIEDKAGRSKSYSYGSNNTGTSTTDANGTELKAGKFVIDYTSPTITDVNFSVLPVGKSDEDNKDYYGYDNDNDLTVTITVVDNNLDQANTKVNGSARQWLQDGNTWTCKVTFTENAVGTDYGLVIDVVDKTHTATGGTENHQTGWSYKDNQKNAATSPADPTGAERFVVDCTSPKVDLIFSPNKAAATRGTNDYYKENVTVTVCVTERNLSNESYDGIRSTIAGIVSRHNQNGSVTLAKNLTQSAASKDVYEAQLTFGETNAGAMYDLGTITASDRVYEIDHTQTAHTTSNQYGRNFFVDLHDPDISVTLDKPLVGKIGAVDYYDATQVTATIQVRDSTFDAARVPISPVNGTVQNASVNNGWTQLNPSTWQAQVVYTETPVDQTAALSLKAVDYVGHETSYAYGSNGSNSFVVDGTQPAITVDFGGTAPVGMTGNTDYYTAKPVATVTVQDRNFDADSSTIEASGYVTRTSEWAQNGENWTQRVEFGENQIDVSDLASTLAVNVQDKVARAGKAEGHTNAWAYATGARQNGGSTSGAPQFVVDMQDPTVGVSIDQAPQQVNYHNTGVDYYGTSNGGILTATITVNDYNFDPDTSPISPTGGVVSSAWTKTSANTWEARVTYGENAQGVVSDLVAHMQDYVKTAAAGVAGHEINYDYGASNTVAGGRSDLGSSFILDLTPPTIENVRALTNYSGIYDTGVSGQQAGVGYIEPLLFYNGGGSGVRLSFADNNGLEAASVSAPFTLEGQSEIGSIDALTLERNVALIEGTAYNSRNELDRNVRVALSDHAGNSRVWLISPTGEIHLVAESAAQAAENTLVNDLVHDATHPRIMVLDQTVPRLSWATSVQEGAFYNTTQQVTLNVEELNFDYLQTYDGGQTVVTVNEYAGNAGRALTPWTRTVSSFGGSGVSWSHTLTFEHDGHYVLTGKLADPANNTSQIEFHEFTIDKTAPRILSITYDNNDVRNGKYYKAPRTATIMVEEHNWDAARSVITSNGSIGGWSDNGDIHTATVFFGTDGDYNLSVAITDKAGNSANQTEPEFTVDLTAPKIEFTNVENEHAYGDDIAPNIVYTDEKNFDNNGYTYELTGAKNGRKSFTASSVAAGNGATVSYADFDRAIDADDIYTLKAHVADLAGNEADGQIVFSVNRFGSNFIVLDAEQYEENNGFLGEAPEVVVEEINVTGSDDSDHGATITRGLDTRNLALRAQRNPEGDGFYIESDKESYGWARYYYHVGTGNYLSATGDTYDDGNYHVTVNSTDLVDNNNNSANYVNHDTERTDSAEVTFTLDTTSPYVENIRVSEGSLFGGGDNVVSFSAIDNIGVEEVSFSYGDTDDVLEQGTTDEYSVNVPVSLFADNEITIIATDFAGNRSDGTMRGDTDSVPDEAKVASGKIVVRGAIWRYLPWLVGAVAVIGLVVFLVVRARRNRQESTDEA